MLNRIKAPFLIHPMVPKDGYSASHLRKGEDYHINFSERPGTKMIWRFEREVLAQEVSGYTGRISHLDFATGTGRVLSALRTAASLQHGLDVSQRMLQVAQQNVPTANLICRDFREGVPELDQLAFDVITAFRFFPNAEPALRDDAMAFLRGKLRDEHSMIICNNHRNFWSVPYVTGRCIGSKFCTGGMTDREMTDLAERHGLIVAKRYSVGVIPQSGTVSLLPWHFTEALESRLLKKWGEHHKFGYDVIYLFKAKQD